MHILYHEIKTLPTEEESVRALKGSFIKCDLDTVSRVRVFGTPLSEKID